MKCGIFPLGEDGVPIADPTLLSTRRAGEELGETTSFLPTTAYNRPSWDRALAAPGSHPTLSAPGINGPILHCASSSLYHHAPHSATLTPGPGPGRVTPYSQLCLKERSAFPTFFQGDVRVWASVSSWWFPGKNHPSGSMLPCQIAPEMCHLSHDSKIS